MRLAADGNAHLFIEHSICSGREESGGSGGDAADSTAPAMPAVIARLADLLGEGEHRVTVADGKVVRIKA